MRLELVPGFWLSTGFSRPLPKSCLLCLRPLSLGLNCLMAMPRTWLPRAEEILDVLRRMKSKQLDRAAIEELFLLQRRAANELMTQAGAPKAKRGEAVLIDRTSLLAWTERIFKDESWQLERRKETSTELSRS